MQFHPTDILIRNKTIWLAHSLLLKQCSGLTDEYMSVCRSKYKATVFPAWQSRQVLPDTKASWRWARINDAFYYAYDNIPDKAPANYRSQLPSKDELQAITATAASQAPATSFEEYFKPFLNTHYSTYLKCYNDCSKTQQVNLAKAAALLEGVVNYIREHNVNIKKYSFFEELGKMVDKLDVKYFPGNPRVIKRKLESCYDAQADRMIQPIVETIRLPRADNDNASKGFYDGEIRSWILQLRGMGANYTNTYIIKKVQDMCALTSKPVPRDRWIGSIMEEHNTNYLTSQERWGAKGRFGALHRGYIPFQNALYAGDCWQIDGTRVNITSHKNVITDKDGNQKKVQAFLYIIAVRDVHSGDILGYHFDLKEDRWAVFNAVKMAAKTAGYLPYEMVFDRFPGHNTPEMETFFGDLRQWGVNVTITSDPNGKAQLERWFGTLQTVFMQDSKYYYGQGIKSRRPYAHRSEEYMARIIREANKVGFDWNAACSEATAIIENYRTTQYCQWSKKHSTVQQSPVQLHEISEKPHTITLQAEDYYYLFGLKVTLPIDGGGLIHKIIHKTDFYYRIKAADYEIISKNSHVLVCYDLDDLSEVMLYSVNDGPIRRFLGRAAQEVEAQRFGPNKDWQAIKQRQIAIDDFAQFREQEREYLVANGTNDVTALLTPTAVSKYNTEAAETAFFNQQHKQAAISPNQVNDLPIIDDEDISYNYLNQL